MKMKPAPSSERRPSLIKQIRQWWLLKKLRSKSAVHAVAAAKKLALLDSCGAIPPIELRRLVAAWMRTYGRSGPSDTSLKSLLVEAGGREWLYEEVLERLRADPGAFKGSDIYYYLLDEAKQFGDVGSLTTVAFGIIEDDWGKSKIVSILLELHDPSSFDFLLKMVKESEGELRNKSPQSSVCIGRSPFGRPITSHTTN